MDSFFGIGIGELFFIAIIALIVLGPERLPGAIREVAKVFRTIRNLSNELTSQFSEEMKAFDDLNPQKILRELTEDPEEEANKNKAATPATKTATKPASKASSSTTAPGKTTTAKAKPETSPVTGNKPVADKPDATPAKSGVGTEAKSEAKPEAEPKAGTGTEPASDGAGQNRILPPQGEPPTTPAASHPAPSAAAASNAAAADGAASQAEPGPEAAPTGAAMVPQPPEATAPAASLHTNGTEPPVPAERISRSDDTLADDKIVVEPAAPQPAVRVNGSSAKAEGEA